MVVAAADLAVVAGVGVVVVAADLAVVAGVGVVGVAADKAVSARISPISGRVSRAYDYNATAFVSDNFGNVLRGYGGSKQQQAVVRKTSRSSSSGIYERDRECEVGACGSAICQNRSSRDRPYLEILRRVTILNKKLLTFFNKAQ